MVGGRCGAFVHLVDEPCRGAWPRFFRNHSGEFPVVTGPMFTEQVRVTVSPDLTVRKGS